jgi:multimeric flavodoxin WrbA
MENKSVLIIDASLRNGFSSKAVENVMAGLAGVGKGIDIERLNLRDYEIKRCIGCCLCLSQGSVRCPHREDGVKELLTRMEAADGIIMVTPNYSLQVPGLLKDFLDRLAYVFHRPRLFGKSFLPVVVQGVYGGKKVGAYLAEAFSFWGTDAVKGAVVSGGIFPGQPQDPAVAAKNQKKLDAAIQRFGKSLYRQKPKAPSYFRMMIFRSTRSSMICFDEALPPDKAYYKEKGWETSDYYYPVSLSPGKRLAGFVADKMIQRMANKPKDPDERKQ